MIFDYRNINRFIIKDINFDEKYDAYMSQYLVIYFKALLSW